MAAILSLVTNVFGSSPFLDKKIVQALSVSSFLWLFASYPLAHTKDKHTDMQAVKDGIYLFFNWLARKLKRVGGER